MTRERRIKEEIKVHFETLVVCGLEELRDCRVGSISPGSCGTPRYVAFRHQILSLYFNWFQILDTDYSTIVSSHILVHISDSFDVFVYSCIVSITAIRCCMYCTSGP